MHLQQGYLQRRCYAVRNVLLFNFAKLIGKECAWDTFSKNICLQMLPKVIIGILFCSSDVFSIAANHAVAIRYIWSKFLQVHLFIWSYNFHMIIKTLQYSIMLFLWSKRRFLNFLDCKLKIHYRAVATTIHKLFEAYFSFHLK